MNYLIYITAFILGILLGRETKDYPIKKKIKVFPKAQPTTYKEKQQQAIKDNKQIIKTFHK